MRIRSVHPEFWRSEDVAAMDWATRLLFIGLWSYVDDNGVGRDVDKLIAADLFPMEDDPRETLATVSRGLQTLSAGGQITRYTIAGKPLLHITSWSTWQRIDRPGKQRFDLPTCDDAVIRDTLATPSRVSRETPATGEGEKGRRGEGVKDSSSPAAPAKDRFDEFWLAYPRKVGKGAAVKAWKTAAKKADEQLIIQAASAFAIAVRGKDQNFTPHPASWLNAERWADDDKPVMSEPQRDMHGKLMIGGGW